MGSSGGDNDDKDDFGNGSSECNDDDEKDVNNGSSGSSNDDKDGESDENDCDEENTQDSAPEDGDNDNWEGKFLHCLIEGDDEQNDAQLEEGKGSSGSIASCMLCQPHLGPVVVRVPAGN